MRLRSRSLGRTGLPPLFFALFADAYFCHRLWGFHFPLEGDTLKNLYYRRCVGQDDRVGHPDSLWIKLLQLLKEYTAHKVGFGFAFFDPLGGPMAIKSLLLVVVFFLSTLGLACSNDDKFGGGKAGHEAYLNWLAKQNLWVQTQNNNGKPVSIEDNKDFFKDSLPEPNGTSNEREVAPQAKTNQNSFWE